MTKMLPLKINEILKELNNEDLSISVMQQDMTMVISMAAYRVFPEQSVSNFHDRVFSGETIELSDEA